MTKQPLQFNFLYKDLVNNIMRNGEDVYNERTKTSCRSIAGANINIDCSGWEFPVLTMRKINIRAFCAEMFWFCMGENNPDNLLNDYTSIWKAFTEDNGLVAAAYGARMRKLFARDQLVDLIETLKKDPSSRQCVVSYWDPNIDGLLNTGKWKNVPCPYTFTVNIMNGKLCFHLIIRSNDIMLGNPYDVSGHALLMFMLAAKLGCEPGIFTVSMSNAHIYENHLEGAKALLSSSVSAQQVIFKPEHDLLDKAMKGDTKALDETISVLEYQYKPDEFNHKFKITL